jgi:hypothetical protein
VRYDLVGLPGWDAFGPGIDAKLDGIRLDFDGDLPAYLTWSNACGFSYGLDVVHGCHEAEGDGFTQVDATAARWSDLVGVPIVEARLVWSPALSEEVPRGAWREDGDAIRVDLAEAVPRAVVNVPQELALRFASDRWVVVSVARYDPKGDSLLGWMDELLVVHDDAFARRFQLGPYAPAP